VEGEEEASYEDANTEREYDEEAGLHECFGQCVAGLFLF